MYVPDEELETIEDEPGLDGAEQAGPVYPWGWRMLGIVLLSSVFLSLVLLGAVQALTGISDPTQLPATAMGAVRIISWLAIFALLWLLAGSPQKFATGLGLKVPSRPWGWTALALALALAAMGSGAALLEADKLEDWAKFLEQPGALVVVAILALTAAPVCEELYYRGLWQGVVRRYMGPRVAVAVAALAFALPHAPQYSAAPISMGVILLVGICAGVLRQSRDSVLPAIGFHFLYNFLTLVSAMIVELLAGAP